MAELFHQLQSIRDKRQKIAVLGLGKSGTAAALRLHCYGFQVECFEGMKAADFQRLHAEDLNTLSTKKIPVEFEVQQVNNPGDYALMVLSPGIGPAYPIAKSFFEAQVSVTNELEIGLCLLGMPSIAVTGTNGKSTTASLIDHILREADIPSVLCGNIGTPVMSLLPTEWPKDLSKPLLPGYAVVEISSYQIETAKSFAPDVGVFLNLSPNHLERHGDMRAYFEAKASLFRRMKSAGTFIYDADDLQINALAQELALRRWGISAKFALGQAAKLGENSKIQITGDGATEDISLIKSSLFGEHNMFNVAAAALACIACGATVQAIQKGIESFRPLEHRLEFVLETPESKIILNDSKSTTIAATETAVEAVRQRYPKHKIILLVGGQSKKGGNFQNDWRDFFVKIQAIDSGQLACVCFGGDGELLQSLAKEVGLEPGRIEKLAQIASVLDKLSAEDNPAILLFSPGCASFDEFRDFEDRGEHFRKWVTEYAH